MRFVESLQMAFDHCNDAVIVAKATPGNLLDGRIVYVNAAMSKETGFALHELDGKPTRFLLTGETPSLDEWRTGGVKSPVRFALAIRRTDGSEVRADTSAWLIRDPEQRTDYITFQHRGGSKADQAAPPDPFDLLPACVVTMDLAGTIIGWNQGATRLTGYSAEEMLGKSVEQLYPEEQRPLLRQYTLPAALAEGPIEIDAALRRKDGGITHAGLALSLLPDGSGAPRAVVGVFIDVTNIKLDEVALTESVELLNAIQGLQSLLISTGDIRLVLEELLSQLLSMTGSEYGFFGEVRKDDHGAPYLGAYSVQSRSKDPDVLRFFQSHSPRGVEFRNLDSLIGYVIRHGKDLMTNAPSSDLRGIGLPAGHPPITSFAGIPLLAGNGMVGMVGLANRPAGYDQALLLRIQPLLDCCASFIEFSRARHRADALGAMFQRGFANTHDPLVITQSDGKIVDWNPEAERLFGYIKSEAVGMSLGELLTQDHDLPGFDNILSALQQNAGWNGEITLRNRPGDDVITETGIFEVAGDGARLFMWVIRDITWRTKTEQELQEVRDRFDAFAQNSRTAFWMSGADGKTILYGSPAYKSVAGFEPDHFPVSSEQWVKMVHPDDYESFRRNQTLAIARGLQVRHKYRIVPADGRIRWIQSHVFPVRNSKGEIYRIAGLMEDVTEHEEADAQLHEALQEKEALLKEIHHRVKNNLQIISSLLRLQARSTADPDSISILQESRNRVETIALIHENLYQSASFSRINFAVYAGRLLANVIGIHQVTPDGVKVTVDIEPLMFDPQTAVLCGLILNELVANALRHAFPGHQKGEIKIQAHARDEKAVIMSVGDNGVGMPQEFDLGQVHSLGIQLVRQLTRQLKGTMSVSSRNGTVVRIEFPFHESLWSAEQEAM